MRDWQKFISIFFIWMLVMVSANKALAENVETIIDKVKQNYGVNKPLKMDMVRRKTDINGNVKSVNGTLWIKGENFRLEFILSGEKRSVEQTLLFDGKTMWILEPDQKAAFRIDVSTFPDDLKKKIIGKNRIGMDEPLFQGQEEFVVSQGQLGNQEFYILRSKESTRNTAYWIGVHDYLIYRVEVNILEQGKEIKLQTEYNSYQFDIDIPDNQFTFVPSSSWKARDVTSMIKWTLEME